MHGILTFVALVVPGWSILKIACDFVIPVHDSARKMSTGYISSRETHYKIVYSIIFSVSALKALSCIIEPYYINS